MLEMPTLIMPGIQVKVRVADMPPAEANGISYRKIPVHALRAQQTAGNVA